MSDNDARRPPETEIRTSFQNLLNAHGYAFQHAVLRRAEELEKKKSSFWKFEASEFPVEVQGYNTHIDFILRRRSDQDGFPGFLVAECKRVNPSFRDWYFATAPYVTRGRRSPELLFEGVKREGKDLLSGVQALSPSGNIYHLSMERKKKKKGEGDSSGGRGVIQESATQVMRGLNGLIQSLCLSNNAGVLPTAPPNAPPGWYVPTTFFVPVIFTTARLWITDADIGAATLETGEVDLRNAKVEERSWLWFQSHISPTLKHSVTPGIAMEPSPAQNDFATILRREYARTIAIVSTSGIDDFLQKDFLYP